MSSDRVDSKQPELNLPPVDFARIVQQAEALNVTLNRAITQNQNVPTDVTIVGTQMRNGLDFQNECTAGGCIPVLKNEVAFTITDSSNRKLLLSFQSQYTEQNGRRLVTSSFAPGKDDSTYAATAIYPGLRTGESTFISQFQPTRFWSKEPDQGKGTQVGEVFNHEITRANFRHGTNLRGRMDQSGTFYWSIQNPENILNVACETQVEPLYSMTSQCKIIGFEGPPKKK